MRLILLALVGALVAWAGPAPRDPQPAPAPAPAPADPDVDITPETDVLGELVVEAKQRRELILPKVAVLSPLGEPRAQLHDVLARDLELSGEFKVITRDESVDFDAPFEAAPFARAGLEAVLTARARELESGELELSVKLYLPKVGDLVAWSDTRVVAPKKRRLEIHRVADRAIGVLTGTDGPFASRLVLVRTEGRKRRAYVVDPDGERLRALSPKEQLVVTAALDAEARPYWAAGLNNGRYKLYRKGEGEPVAVSPSGSIYGIAFSPKRDEVALSIASGSAIQLYRGQLGDDALSAYTRLDFALSPAYAPDGRLVYAGTRGRERRVFVDRKPVSPPQVAAQSPTVCKHPDGPRIVYTVGLGKNQDLVSSGLDGKDLRRLTWGSARNFAPACSPDGRLIAFFSTRRRGDGPGLYLMRIDGHRIFRVNATHGDVLAWVRVPVPPPAPAAPIESDVEVTTPATETTPAGEASVIR